MCNTCALSMLVRSLGELFFLLYCVQERGRAHHKEVHMPEGWQSPSFSDRAEGKGQDEQAGRANIGKMFMICLYRPGILVPDTGTPHYSRTCITLARWSPCSAPTPSARMAPVRRPALPLGCRGCAPAAHPHVSPRYCQAPGGNAIIEYVRGVISLAG
jgi:hypothetical protein